ncbi:MAG: D-alanine--D-serine ligase VanG [Defluviitaleaceae bacterium]|nr:D-alanine--D-serine ligase VanG [Defluviitaleaceae bacterium]
MNKKKIAVIFGGCSTEYEISLESAFSVITHMGRYEPVLLGITPTGQWYLYKGPAENIANDTWCTPQYCTKAIISLNRETQGILVFTSNSTQTIKIDAVLPILHGKNGEDGTIQGLLSLAGIPIIGCGVLASALCMDKDRAHKLAEAAGVRVPQAVTLQCESQMDTALQEAGKLGFPLFVKPIKSGSSFGVTKVLTQEQLPAAIKNAFVHDNEVIIEENIEGFEVGCAIIGSQNLIVGQVDEVELSDGFFDYKEKYNLETSKIHVPARIAAHKADEIKETAKIIYQALGCSGFARVDMFLTPKGEIIFNEVNTIPGVTTHSRFPNMLKAIGMTFEEIIDEIIKQAVGM